MIQRPPPSRHYIWPGPNHVTDKLTGSFCLARCSLLSVSLSLATLGAIPPPSALSSVPTLATVQSGPTLPLAPHPFHMPAVFGEGGPQPTALPVSSQQGLVLSPAAEPLPKKLVDKIRSGQFVEMRELLADNVSLVHQLETVQGAPAAYMLGTSRPRLREVTSLISWCYCFMGYVAASTPDTKTRDQLAYARLIINEAQRHGGQGWLDYDHAFRQQVAADPSIRWNTLNPGLQASTILGRGMPNAGSFCTLCRGVDHTRFQCALACLQPSAAPRTPVTRPYPALPPARRKPTDICFSWNRGNCIYPGQCHYRHVCLICQQQHKARDCPKPPDPYSARPPMMGLPLARPPAGPPTSQ